MLNIYLGFDLSVAGTIGDEVRYRVGEGAKVLAALRSVWKEELLSVGAKMAVIVTIVFYASLRPIMQKSRKRWMCWK